MLKTLICEYISLGFCTQKNIVRSLNNARWKENRNNCSQNYLAFETEDFLENKKFLTIFLTLSFKILEIEIPDNLIKKLFPLI